MSKIVKRQDKGYKKKNLIPQSPYKHAGFYIDFLFQAKT